MKDKFDPYVLWPLAKKFGQTKKNVDETQQSADKHGEKLQLLRWMLEKKFGGLQLHFFGEATASWTRRSF